MAELRSGIAAAADSGKWYTESKWSTDSAVFLDNGLSQVEENVVQEEMARQPAAASRSQPQPNPGISTCVIQYDVVHGASYE